MIDGATHNTLATIPVGRGPSTVAINRAANRIYVGNAIERSLTIIDGATNRVVRTLALTDGACRHSRRRHPVAGAALYLVDRH